MLLAADKEQFLKKVFLNEEKLIMISYWDTNKENHTDIWPPMLQCEGQFKLKNKFPGNYLI